MSIRRRFWYDHAASEEPLLALLDALAVANRTQKRPKSEEGWRKCWDAWLKIHSLKRGKELSGREKQELEALREVLHSIYSVDKDGRKGLPKRDRVGMLPSDAGVYLCWYSQLRDLISRHPKLAGKLRVCSLPGGGFTGDWHLGIVQGSVSLALGTSIIDILCSKGEQHKRLARGVGLPVLPEFFADRKKKFMAWPGSHGIPLQAIYKIHQEAMSRAHIKGYDRCRSAIVAVARGLAPIENEGREDKGQAEINAIGRLFGQIAVLRGK